MPELPLLVGQALKSYCGGYFGRDFFGGRIEAIGWDWVIARSFSSGNPAFAWFKGGIVAHAKTIAGWNEMEGEWPDL